MSEKPEAPDHLRQMVGHEAVIAAYMLLKADSFEHARRPVRLIISAVIAARDKFDELQKANDQFSFPYFEPMRAVSTALAHAMFEVDLPNRASVDPEWGWGSHYGSYFEAYASASYVLDAFDTFEGAIDRERWQDVASGLSASRLIEFLDREPVSTEVTV